MWSVLWTLCEGSMWRTSCLDKMYVGVLCGAFCAHYVTIACGRYVEGLCGWRVVHECNASALSSVLLVFLMCLQDAK